MKRDPSGALLCRPARQSDRDQVMALTRTIWDGEDYLPQVWDDWMSEAQALPTVAEWGGRVVGLSRLLDLGWGDWWLEGLRVDPAKQGKGIASALHRYQVGRWAQTDGLCLRFFTHAKRVAVQHLANETGFKMRARFVKYEAPAERGEHRLEPVHDADAVVGLIHADAPGSEPGLLERNWRCFSLRPERLNGIGGAGRGWAWPEGTGCVVLWVDRSKTPNEARIQALRCQEAHLIPFLTEVRHLARTLGCPFVRWMAPYDQRVEAALIGAGYSTDWEHQIVLFEKSR